MTCGRAARVTGRSNPNRKAVIEPKIVSPTRLKRDLLDLDAVRALERLQSRSFEAYLVGGCVRDLLLGRQPKDFDIATAARPTQVKRTFPRNCRIIGRRFKLAHLHFNQNRKILEVATFRTSPTAEGDSSDDLLITRDNEFGSAEEDALRRDFTVNALFFDPIQDRIIDYTGGLADVENRLLRTIGDPVVRFREDPVRIIRAAKFAGRLSFQIAQSTYEAMAEVAPDLSRSAPPRLLEEILRLLRGGHSLESFQILRDIGALKVILPVVAGFLAEAPEPDRVQFWRMLEALDTKILAGEELPSAVLLGVLFAAPVRASAETENRRSWTTVSETLIGPFATELRLPRRDAGCLKRICGVQPRFTAQGQRRFKTGSFLRDPYFPEALQLFELTCMASGQGLDDLRRWKGMPPERTLVDDADDEDAPEASGVAHADDGAAGEHEERAREREPEREPEPEHERERGARRRRRRRRGRRSGADGRKPQRDREPSAAEDAAPAEVRAPEPSAPPSKPARPEGAPQRDRDRGRRGKRRSRRRAEGPGSTGAREREVQTIEPEPFDLSAFDMELDPRRVPTFGVIVEGAEGKKKRKTPKLPSLDDTDYRPPQPPSQDPEPPAPAAPDDFGDW